MAIACGFWILNKRWWTAERWASYGRFVVMAKRRISNANYSHPQRLTYDFVKKLFTNRGCELLSPEYKNARTHLEYKCSCGNVSKIIFDSFRRGHGCSECGHKKANAAQKLTIEEVRAAFAQCGCELLSDKYVNSHQKLKFRCSCGTVSEIQYNNFRVRKRCGECGLRSRSGKNHYDWIEDRQKQRYEYLLKQRCYKILRRPFALLGQNKLISNRDLYGYNTRDLIKHIVTHPNWEQVKDKVWHIDHIFPIRAFLDFGIVDPVLINSLDNLRPVSGSFNLQKHDQYDRIQFIEWLRSKGVILE